MNKKQMPPGLAALIESENRKAEEARQRRIEELERENENRALEAQGLIKIAPMRAALFNLTAELVCRLGSDCGKTKRDAGRVIAKVYAVLRLADEARMAPPELVQSIRMSFYDVEKSYLQMLDLKRDSDRWCEARSDFFKTQKALAGRLEKLAGPLFT